MKRKLLSLLITEMLFSSYLAASEINLLKEQVCEKKLLSTDNSNESSPILQGTLDSHILAEFMPFIMAEVLNEFDHQNDLRTRRDTRQYGLNFFKMLNGDFSYEPPPEFLQQLGACICKTLGHEPIEFNNIILSFYEEGSYLEPHVDVNVKNLYGNSPFYFSERVYGIVIEPDPTGHLYFAKWEGEGLVPPLDIEPIYSLIEQTGSIFCLEGDFRKTPYFHAVSPVSNRRISITFRTVEKLF